MKRELTGSKMSKETDVRKAKLNFILSFKKKLHTFTESSIMSTSQLHFINSNNYIQIMLVVGYRRIFVVGSHVW